jgi:ABC-type phosphate transport system substrate-binding protein
MRSAPERSCSNAGHRFASIANRREAGGPDAAIRPYQRTRNSGSQELMQKLVMKERAMIKAPDLLVETLMSSSFLTIHKDVQGIGYTVYYYQEFMAPPGPIKACAVEEARSRVNPIVHFIPCPTVNETEWSWKTSLDFSSNPLSRRR